MTGMERRRQRSERPSEALHLLLRSTADRYKLDAIVLADHDGLVIQSTGDPQACDLVAAYAPLLNDHHVQIESVRASLGGSVPAMGTCVVGHRTIGGLPSELHVCAIGVARNNLDHALQHATGAISRILRQLSVA